MGVVSRRCRGGGTWGEVDCCIPEMGLEDGRSGVGMSRRESEGDSSEKSASPVLSVFGIDLGGVRVQGAPIGLAALAFRSSHTLLAHPALLTLDGD